VRDTQWSRMQLHTPAGLVLDDKPTERSLDLHKAVIRAWRVARRAVRYVAFYGSKVVHKGLVCTSCFSDGGGTQVLALFLRYRYRLSFHHTLCCARIVLLPVDSNNTTIRNAYIIIWF
jgi:hypothetical protein